ncbi:hypothetical protein Esti_001565 [Eimeria stiedai]
MVSTLSLWLLLCVHFAWAEVGLEPATDSLVVGESAPVSAADNAASASLGAPDDGNEASHDDPKGNSADTDVKEESGLPISLEEAEAEARKWVCGRNTQLFFIIANTRSGSCVGAKYLTSLPMVEARHECSEVKVFSQLEPTSMALGVDHIRRAVNALKTFYAHEHGPAALAKMSEHPAAVPLESRIRVITVGGDGGFALLVTALFREQIDMNWVATGIIPSGTGNDMGHSYGWTRARFPTSNPLGPGNIEKLLRTLQSSELALHDLWQVVVKADPVRGRFEAYKNDEGRVVAIGRDRNGGPRMKTFHLNIYFGLGFDGLVGVAFDQLRGRSRLWNRAVYGLNFLRYIGTSPFVCDSVDTLYTFNPKLVALLSNSGRYDKVPGILPCVSLTFLNSKTIIGGLELWGPSTKIGLRPPRDARVAGAYKAFVEKLQLSRMDSGDGHIEIFSMAKTIDYARAQTVRANAISRVMQGPGPFLLTFNEPVPFMPIQVDGEFFIVRYLSSVSRYRGFSSETLQAVKFCCLHLDLAFRPCIAADELLFDVFTL